MINADEHKKLLEQITELERNSVNYFDVEKEFFLIDSNNLADVQTCFYGYSIQRDGIYEEDNLTPEAVTGLDGRGCYVYVEVKDGKITIKQDLNGCWGIYLFRHGDYFALSNSFFRLLDHVKFLYPLTVNRNYCQYLSLQTYASYSYSETAVNEIKLIDRNATATIDMAAKNLQIDIIDCKDHTLSLDSEEGIAALDRWFEFWCDVMCGIAGHTQFIQADLSGGFDSRISIVPLLSSGADLNKIRFFSIHGSNLHTHKEDYDIASKIADHYGFKLNQPLPSRKYLNHSLTDAWNKDLYGNQTFSIIPRFSSIKSVDKFYWLSGMGGEGMRATFGDSLKDFIENEERSTNFYHGDLANELSNSVENILKSAFLSIQNKYKIKAQNPEDIMLYFPRDTVNRNHCGKEVVMYYFSGNFRLSVIFDPDLYSLKLNTAECPDSKLLMAMIFTRYAPDLLTFPFDSNHFIAPETIKYAKKINERFPRRPINNAANRGGGVFHLRPRDTQAEKILSSGLNNPNLPGGLLFSCLREVFNSGRTHGLFATYFDSEIYRYATFKYDTDPFRRYRTIYAVVGIAKVLEDVEISRRNYQPYQDMQRFLEQDFVTISNHVQIPDKFKPYLTARVDVKLMTAEGDFQIISVSDNKATVQKPGWLQKDGIGYQIQSYVGNLEIVATSTVKGRINLNLMGLDIHDTENSSKRIPYWIDYTKLTINGNVIFDKITPAWHNKLYTHNMDAKAGEEIKIQVEWLPHRSDTGT